MSLPIGDDEADIGFESSDDDENAIESLDSFIRAHNSKPGISDSTLPSHEDEMSIEIELGFQNVNHPRQTSLSQKRRHLADKDRNSPKKKISLSGSSSFDLDFSDSDSPVNMDKMGIQSDASSSPSDIDWDYFVRQDEMLPESKYELEYLTTIISHNYKGLIQDNRPDVIENEEPWYPYDPTEMPGLQTDSDLSAMLEEGRLKGQNNLICYGMIHQVRVKVLATGIHLLKRLNITHTTSTDSQQKDLYVFRVHSETENSKYTLQPPLRKGAEILSYENIAVLNKDACSILSSIASTSACVFTAYSTVEEWNEVNEDGNETSEVGQDITILVDIVIYGGWEHCERTGDVLANRNVYLQEPDFRDMTLEYRNPHFIDYEFLEQGTQQVAPTQVPTITTSNFETRIEAPSPQLAVVQATLDKRIEAVFEKTTRAKNLKRLAADTRIIPDLKPWQEEALDFIAQREFGPIQEGYSLWKQNSSNSYSHVITGSIKTELPSETGGGILADEMGLGKTLTMLSAMVRTTDEAKMFAFTSQNENSLNVETKLIHSRATVVIVPSPLLLNEWLQQIKKHCTGFSHITIYHSQGREGNPKILADSDIILSTFHTIAAEYRDRTSPLWQIEWFRIVLDEAHTIRRMTTKLFRAISKLKAHLRWCLTGTPIQNSLDDLAALVSFIRCKPLDKLHMFKQYISSPLMKGSANSLDNLRQLLDSVCLRRTQQLLYLPEPKLEPQLLVFSAREQKQYVDTREKLIKLINQNQFQPHKKGYLGVFQLQLQLRRLCNHGTFQKASLEFDEFDPEQAIAHLKEHKEATCAVCASHVTGIHGIEEQRTGSFTTCGHLLCGNCVPRMTESLTRVDARDGCMTCSLCLKIVWGEYIVRDEKTKFSKSKISGSKGLSAWQYFDKEGCSTKVSSLVANIEQHKVEEKSIVFSCWTRSLDLVGIFLLSRNIPFVRIDGSHTLKQRENILRHYESDPMIRVLLMTTGTGAVGLNLTSANCVHILEPQWNPMVESQAIARVNRLGQTKNVRVVRYIIKDTVEELELQTQQIRKLEYAKVGWKEN